MALRAERSCVERSHTEKLPPSKETHSHKAAPLGASHACSRHRNSAERALGVPPATALGEGPSSLRAWRCVACLFAVECRACVCACVRVCVMQYGSGPSGRRERACMLQLDAGRPRHLWLPRLVWRGSGWWAGTLLEDSQLPQCPRASTRSFHEPYNSGNCSACLVDALLCCVLGRAVLAWHGRESVTTDLSRDSSPPPGQR